MISELKCRCFKHKFSFDPQTMLMHLRSLSALKSSIGVSTSHHKKVKMDTSEPGIAFLHHRLLVRALPRKIRSNTLLVPENSENHSGLSSLLSQSGGVRPHESRHHHSRPPVAKPPPRRRRAAAAARACRVAESHLKNDSTRPQ